MDGISSRPARTDRPVWDVSGAGSHERLTIGDWWWGVDDAEFSPDGTRLATIGWPSSGSGTPIRVRP
jgi:hypothetical protein